MARSAVPERIETRPATEADFPAILDLGRRALGWAGNHDDARLFAWKHVENPFGPSPLLVAVAGERIVGLRAFMRWQFVRPDGTPVVAARAVDTATDPEYQGRGIFTRLTLAALDRLRAAGVELVFNTPNRSSLPGYLKMGWHAVGRLPVAVMPTRPRSLLVLTTARRAASRWSVETSAGESPLDVLADTAAVDRLLASRPAPAGLSTPRSRELLVWRYSFDALHYRVVPHRASPDEGFAVFRLRRRGRAVEAVVCDVITPGDDPAVARALVRRIARISDADYLIRLDRRPVTRDPFVRVFGVGPVLTCRPLNGPPAPTIEEWALTMGDVELF